MTKSKSETKADKMVKPSKSVRPFNFPAHNLTIEAKDINEAEEKLEEYLKSKPKKDD